MASRKPLVQWSIRELFCVLVIGTVVIGSMWAHPAMVWFVMLFTMLLVFSMLTIAMVGRGDWRWFGAGFSVFAIGYFATLIFVERSEGELPQFMPQMPTTYLLMLCQESVTYRSFIKDGDVVSSDLGPVLTSSGLVTDRNGNALGEYMGSLPSGFIPGLAGNSPGTVVTVLTPGPFTYHTLGQIFFMLLLGYLGGKFAVAFARFQDRQEEIVAQNG